MTGKEIVQALRCCAEGECKDCAMHEDKQRCQENLLDQAAEAIELLNQDSDQKFGALVFGDVWPLPEKLLREKTAKAKVVINVEQNFTGQLASLISEVTGIRVDKSVLKYDGRPLSAVEIKNKVLEVLS